MPIFLGGATTTSPGYMSAADKIRAGQIIDAQADLGFVGDLITTNSTSSCSTAAPTKITDSSNPFTSAYLNARITLSGAGPGGAQYVGTITNIDSAGQVTVSPSISTTVTNKIANFGTDNTAAINAMQTLVNTTNAAFPGTKILFGDSATNAYGFPIPVVFNKTVEIEGVGSGFNTDNGDYSRIGGTRLAWWGTTSDGGVDFGAFFTIQPGSGATQAIKAPSFNDIWLDGRNGDQQAALYGIRFAGCHAPILENVFFIDFRAAGLLCNATAISLTPTADRGVLRPSFRKVFIRNLESFTGAITTPITTSTAITLTNTGQNITVSAATMPTDTASTSYAWIQTNEGPRVLVKYTGGGTTTLNVKCSVEIATHGLTTVANAFLVSAAPVNATCITLDGDTTANTNCGIIDLAQLTHGSVWGPSAIAVRNADSMEFVSIFINGGDPTTETNPLINRTRKEGVTFEGSQTNVGLAARNNTFRGGDPSSANAAGVTSFGLLGSGAMMAFPAGPNYWDLMQLGNGARLPITETGACFYWNPNGGVRPLDNALVSTTQQAITVSTTLQQITGTVLPIPPQLKPGFCVEWDFACTKTAAGTSPRVWTVKLGAANTNADATIGAITNVAGSAAIDTAIFKIRLQVFTTTQSTGTLTGNITLSFLNNLAATGFTTSVVGVGRIQQVALSNTNTNVSGLLYLGVYMSAAATGEVITFQQVQTRVIKAANP